MSSTDHFIPAVLPQEVQPEFTLRAVLLGAVLGIIYGAASTYMALRVGLTVSASVPIAVLAISVLKARAGKRAILEHNITQTAGSAGESVAGALVFTVPALIFLGYPLDVGLSTLIALTGGVLGVLLMVPLRRALIVKEHGVLRYPEGKACAEILKAGERGGMSARKIFAGLGIGAAIKAFQAFFGGVGVTSALQLNFYKKTSIASDFEPPLLGVGYIIGYRTSLMMVAGSLLASFILVPMVLQFGSHAEGTLGLARIPIGSMTETDVWKNYIRYIGAGAVATGGIIGLIRAIPAIVSSLRASAKSMMGGATTNTVLRTDRDTPTLVLILGALGIVGFVWLSPWFQMNLLGAVLILVLGFLFAVVSSRITGEVGSSSSPLSGMTIGILMATCGAFLLAGWETHSYAPKLALMVGAVVCVAISNAGTCSQDLKTGFLVGATPVLQQLALLVGVVTSVLAVGWTTYLLNLAETKEMPPPVPFTVSSSELGRGGDAVSKGDSKPYRFLRVKSDEFAPGVVEGNYLVDKATGAAVYKRVDGIGSERFGAPQSKLMSLVIDGILSRQLPWDLILIGVAIALFVELLGIGSLTFAVGVYLPLAATFPVFLGGLARKIADRKYKRALDAEDEPEGILWCSGLIAGASLVAIAGALLSFDSANWDDSLSLHRGLAFLRDFPAWLDSSGMWKGLGVEIAPSSVLGFAILGLLTWLIVRGAAPSTSDRKSM